MAHVHPHFHIVNQEPDQKRDVKRFLGLLGDARRQHFCAAHKLFSNVTDAMTTGRNTLLLPMEMWFIL